jgi:hypothetical protein
LIDRQCIKLVAAMTVNMYDYKLLPIFLVSLILLLGCSEIGRQLAVRVAGKGRDQILPLESALLALLALMIGFTFSIALSHFDRRREAILTEANAIGTAALCGRLLPAPHAAEVLKLLREYAQIHLDITERIPSQTELSVVIGRSNALQEALWQQAKAVLVQNNGVVPTGSFLQALNEMIDSQETRLTALRAKLPNVVLIALYGVTLVAAGFSGYASGLDERRSRLPVHIMMITISSLILLIQDLDRPGAGFIEVSQQPMIDIAASIAAYTP